MKLSRQQYKTAYLALLLGALVLLALDMVRRT